MQIKQYLKGVAGAVLGPVIKSLTNISPYWGAGLSMATERIFSYSLDGYAAYGNKIFYSALNILVRKLTEPPITFSKRKSGTGRQMEKFYSKNITNEKRVLVKKQSLEEVENHECNRLFDIPNTYQTGIEMMEDFWYNYAFGDGYLFFETLGDGSRNTKPVRVHSISRNRMMPLRSDDQFDRIYGYRFTAWNGKQIDISKEYVLHLKHWNPNFSDLRGLGVDVLASMDISLNNAGGEAEGAAFVNGGRGTLFSTKADYNADSGKQIPKMTAEQMGMLKETVDRDLSGARNNRRLKFVNGEVVVTPYGDTLAEMEINKSEDSRWKNIFTTVGVPWVLSPADASVSENTVKVGFKSLVTNTCIPELKKFDQKLTQKLQQWWAEIVATTDLTEYTELAPDLELMQKVYGSPLLSVNEARAIFGYDDLDGDEGEAILVDSNKMMLSDIIDASEPDLANPSDGL